MLKHRIVFMLLGCLLAASSAWAQFDHSHEAWTVLLKRHVVLIDGGKASQVRYDGFAKDRAALRSYLESLSKVNEREFKGWSRDDQLAFLINAYNGHMVELILTRYPTIKSVWDFGKLFNNPFKNRFFTLFGREFTLDMIEHDTIRARGVYDDPRIHMAVNCASIGCPMLREEAYAAARLDKQLDEQVARFLSDRSRNRYNPAKNALEVSEVFKWYSVDFASGLKGIKSREQFFADYANALADNSEQQEIIRDQKVEIRFLDYDWALNDANR
ncbi:MAG: hypothetical protein A3G24_07540 [Betaproteobacteria bacterium RIFCSPLOWO2_12_FULL_62_13]|nr:MAG: hypothetical protein A3G24_07540 [Betaproteobacteria bacterium RIFCSPLOWO2_12_FULL_62_13]